MLNIAGAFRNRIGGAVLYLGITFIISQTTLPRSENYDAVEHVMFTCVNPDHPVHCEGQQQQQQ